MIRIYNEPRILRFYKEQNGWGVYINTVRVLQITDGFRVVYSDHLSGPTHRTLDDAKRECMQSLVYDEVAV